MIALKERPECPPLSFGISVAPDDVDEATKRTVTEGETPVPQALAKLADERMYEMKHLLSDIEREQRTTNWLAAKHVDL
jgi:hypothetical protein